MIRRRRLPDLHEQEFLVLLKNQTIRQTTFFLSLSSEDDSIWGTGLDGYLTKKLRIFVLFDVHIVDYSTTF